MSAGPILSHLPQCISITFITESHASHKEILHAKSHDMLLATLPTEIWDKHVCRYHIDSVISICPHIACVV